VALIVALSNGCVVAPALAGDRRERQASFRLRTGASPPCLTKIALINAALSAVSTGSPARSASAAAIACVFILAITAGRT